MKRSGFTVWAGIFIYFWVFPGLVFAGPPDNYTANLVMEGMSMSIAKMGGKTRSESPMLQGMVNLHLLDAQKMIMMSPANKTYMEQPDPRERYSFAHTDLLHRRYLGRF